MPKAPEGEPLRRGMPESPEDSGFKYSKQQKVKYLEAGYRVINRQDFGKGPEYLLSFRGLKQDKGKDLPNKTGWVPQSQISEWTGR